MRETEEKYIKYSVRAFLAKLDLDGDDVVDLKAVYVNGRWVTSPNKIDEVGVVLLKLKEAEG